MNSISVVIPAFNAEKNLKDLYRQLIPVLNALADKFEVIIVDDCSRDNTWRVIQGLAQQDSCVKGVRFSKNFGQHNALLCGIRMAKNEVIVTCDDDLQHPPGEIPRIIEKLNQGYDVVYGAPEKQEHSFLRTCASVFTKVVLRRVMGIKNAVHAGAFRAFRTNLRVGFERYDGPFVNLDVLLAWTTTKFSFVYVKHLPRKSGASNYNVFKLLTHAFNLVTGFSTIPLQVASIVGFFFTLFGIGILVYVVGRYFVTESVPGFPFLASIIAIFSGAQLFALGIIGEYLSRIHFKTMNRPPYLVHDKCNLETTAHYGRNYQIAQNE